MKRITILILFIIPIQLVANTNKNIFNNSNTTAIRVIKDETIPNVLSRRINIALELQELYTTHWTYFTGTGLVLNYNISRVSSFGLGVEYAHSNSHDDNGWQITKLNFIPVFINTKYNLATWGKFTSRAQLSTGVTFKKYRKVWADDASPSYASRWEVPPAGIFNISEKGWYMYSGIGISYKISNKLSTYIDVGFKAFHMSWNPWEINPHGISMKLGITL